MTTYRTHDLVRTQAGSRATYQWPLGNGKCKVWVAREDWNEVEPYPCKGPTAPLIVDVDSLSPMFMGVRK